MKNEQVQAYIDEIIELLSMDKMISDTEAAKRAAKFNEARAILILHKDELSDEVIKAKSIEKVVYGDLMSKQPGDKVTAKTAVVEALPDYVIVRETLEINEKEVSSLEALLRLFTDAHVFYRQLAKPQGNF